MIDELDSDLPPDTEPIVPLSTKQQIKILRIVGLLFLLLFVCCICAVISLGDQSGYSDSFIPNEHYISQDLSLFMTEKWDVHGISGNHDTNHATYFVSRPTTHGDPNLNSSLIGDVHLEFQKNGYLFDQEKTTYSIKQPNLYDVRYYKLIDHKDHVFIKASSY